jgi:hypothetical protein
LSLVKDAGVILKIVKYAFEAQKAEYLGLKEGVKGVKIDRSKPVAVEENHLLIEPRIRVYI